MFFFIALGVFLIGYVVIDTIITAAVIDSISESTIAALQSISQEEGE
ncbi:hypothetical protein K8T06_17120 [bacterium]|nr:hypothetical protein [bacterium]